MEKECVSVSNTNSVQLDENHTQSSAESSSLTQQDYSQRPTTSRASSMSQLQEDEYCVSNSRHEFAEVVDDDETTTSGVLETYEISSSNSLPPTSSDAPVAPVVAVDDSSSTDTLRHDEGEHSDSIGSESRHAPSNFFNADSEVYIINDEDEDEEDGDVIDDVLESDVHGEGDADSRLEENPNASVSLERHLNGIIVTADGSKIFLETPVVEEQMHHHNHLGNLVDGLQDDYNEKAGKPKRLSDEFMLEENIEHSLGNEMKYAQEDEPLPEFVAMEMAPSSSLSTASVVGCDRFNINVGSVEASHDRIMSVRLKKMSLTNSNNSNFIIHNNNSGSGTGNNTNLVVQDMATISQFQAHQAPSIADIESMDLIERRDFETEQRLTGGTILKSTSILNKNMLNISLIKSCMQQQQKKNVSQDHPNDDWPSSSHGPRVVSSDSKCSYKDLSSTPTSSRKYSSNRLTKSTAKMNLCSTLSSSFDHPKPETSCAETEKSAVPLSASSDIAEPIAETSSTSSTQTCSLLSTGAARTEMYNANSNPNEENFASTTTVMSTLRTPTNGKGVYQNDCGLAAAIQQSASNSASNTSSADNADLGVDGGCSRTSALHAYSAGLAFDDAQPSTSSARCQYGSASRNGRQVNASAQTNERFLSRAAGLGCDIAFVSGNGERMQRRRTDSAIQTMQRRNSAQDDIILVEGDGIVTDRGGNGEFSADDSWADCDEDNIGSDLEEICTCQQSAFGGSSHGGSSTSLNESGDMLDVGCESYILDDIAGGGVTDSALITVSGSANTAPGQLLQRKRKYNEGRMLDNDYCLSVTSSGGSVVSGENICRKRIAYDFTSTPRSSQAAVANTASSMIQTSTASLSFACGSTVAMIAASASPIGRRTPRSLIPTRDNPPPELQQWLAQFQRWSHAERLVALDRLIDHCDPAQVRHMMKVIEPQFQRDFISLLPRELALSVLSYLDPNDLLRAAQTCRSWRFLCDDNLLWKEKCRKEQILTEPRTDRPKRGRAGNMPPIASPWKAAYMRQHIIEMNWRSRPVREPKVLKGHDDHVITCLQFSGNRIVSGSDDNTLKVWSAVTGRCLRTLVGHTGGVWSSQMSGNIIISGSTDRTLKVWDMETGLCVHTLQGHTSTVRCMHLHGDKVVSGSRDATLRVWDIEQGSCLHVLVGHLAAVRCVQYDGKLIVSGAYDYMVKIWHPERQECLHTLQGHTNRVYSLQFDGIHVVSGSLDTSIRVWDAETGNCKHTLMGHQSLTSGMELRQNILVSGNADSTVKVWDITTGQCLQTLSGPNKHQSAVTCLQFNSRFVVTSSDDGTVKLWDVKTGDFIRNLVALESGGSGGVVWRIRANDTKLICAVGSRNGTEETKLMVLDFDVEGACVKCS